MNRRFVFLFSLTAVLAFAERPLRNADIVVLVHKGASVSQIVEKINNSASGFQMDSDDVRSLKQEGVPQVIIQAMFDRNSGRRTQLDFAPEAETAVVSQPMNAYGMPEPAPKQKQAAKTEAPLNIAPPSKVSTGAVRGDEVSYVGGTLTLPAGTRSRLDLTERDAFRFHSFAVPYTNITSLEFGQKVGRRVGATVALGATTLGLAALPMLFSHKKKHYLTVGFVAEGRDEVAVFELPKGLVQTTLPVMESRAGKKIRYQMGK